MVILDHHVPSFTSSVRWPITIVNHMTERTSRLDGDAIPGIFDPDFCRPRFVDDLRSRSANPKIKHDLKNQLGVILGFSELLLADLADDDPRRPDVMEIRGALESAMELVRSL